MEGGGVRPSSVHSFFEAKNPDRSTRFARQARQPAAWSHGRVRQQEPSAFAPSNRNIRQLRQDLGRVAKSMLSASSTRWCGVPTSPVDAFVVRGFRREQIGRIELAARSFSHLSFFKGVRTHGWLDTICAEKLKRFPVLRGLCVVGFRRHDPRGADPPRRTIAQPRGRVRRGIRRRGGQIDDFVSRCWIRDDMAAGLSR